MTRPLPWVTAHARGAFSAIAEHVLLPFAASIREADERLAPRVGRELLDDIAAAVPPEWLDGEDVSMYADYLEARLAEPRAWVEEAERVR